MHCLQAAFKSILKHYLPDRDFSFELLDKMSHTQSGKGTWWPPLLLELTKLGLKAKDIGPFDYKQFYSEEEPYARSFYPEEVAECHLNRTSLPLIKSLLPEFLEKVDIEARPATLLDIKENLASGCWSARLSIPGA
jgi:hypothetical protein